MERIAASYRFQRPANSVVGFGRTNQASTDAFGALHRWRTAVDSREFNVLVDNNDYIEAELTFDINDEHAGSQLDALCLEHGVERSPVK